MSVRLKCSDWNGEHTCAYRYVSERLAMYLPLLPKLYSSPRKSGLSCGASTSSAQFQYGRTPVYPQRFFRSCSQKWMNVRCHAKKSAVS